MTLTTAIRIAIFLGLLIFLLYSHFQKLKCYFFRAPSNQNTTVQFSSSPSQGTLQGTNKERDTSTEREVVSTSCTTQPTNEQKDTKAEREVVFTAYSTQPSHWCRCRQLYSNGRGWYPQIHANLAFSLSAPATIQLHLHLALYVQTADF